MSRGIVLFVGEKPEGLIDLLGSALHDVQMRLERVPSNQSRIQEMLLERPSVRAVVCSLNLADEGMILARTEIEAERAAKKYADKIKELCLAAVDFGAKALCYGPMPDPRFTEEFHRKCLKRVDNQVQEMAKRFDFIYIDVLSWSLQPLGPNASFAPGFYDNEDQCLTETSHRRMLDALDLEIFKMRDDTVLSEGQSATWNSPPHDWQASLIDSTSLNSHSKNTTVLQQLPPGSWYAESMSINDEKTFDKVQESYEEHFGSHKAYMETKRAKFAAQQIEDKAIIQKSKLFARLQIWINGYCNQGVDLTGLILQHGGHIHTTDNALVTHVVCDQLAANKLIKASEKRRSKKTFVRPAWLIDSSKRGVLLPLGPKYNVLLDHNAGNTLDQYVLPEAQAVPAENKVHSATPIMTQNDKMPQSPSRIDPEVFKSLPQDVLRQLEADCRRAKFRSALPQTPIPAPVSPIPLPQQQESDGVPLFAPESCAYNEIARPLLRFMRRCRRPGPRHAALLLEIVAIQVVQLNCLEDAASTLRLLQDTATYELPRWTEAIQMTTDLAQRVVALHFRGVHLVLRASDYGESHTGTDRSPFSAYWRKRRRKDVE